MTFGKRNPIGFHGLERRRHSREKTDVAAQIVLATGQSVTCRVIDFSKTGARLTVASAFGVPDTFELRAGGGTYQVTVIRRGIGHVAVRFT